MPGPATFNTPFRLLAESYRNAGKLDQDADPTPTQLANGINRLNDLINLEQTQGLKLWLLTDISIIAPTLAAGLALYTLGPGGNVVMTKPLRVIEAYYVDSSSNRRPIDPPLSRDEYTRLSSVTIQGAISSYFVDKQLASLNVYLWNTPDAQAATGQVHLVVQTQVTNMIGLNDTVSFPIEWFMYLHWSLGAQFATGQPQAIIDRCDKQAAFYREKLEGWDVEDADTRFKPDQRISQGFGKFI